MKLRSKLLLWLCGAAFIVLFVVPAILALIKFYNPPPGTPVPMPVAPVEILRGDAYLDGGSLGLHLRDSDNHTYHIWLFLKNAEAVLDSGAEKKYRLLWRLNESDEYEAVQLKSPDGAKLLRAIELAAEYRKEHPEPGESGYDASLGVVEAVVGYTARLASP